MAAPISIRLDDEVRATREADAKEHGVGLATYLRNVERTAQDSCAQHGLDRISFAPGYMVTAASKRRIDGAQIGRITPAQLHAIRA